MERAKQVRFLILKIILKHDQESMKNGLQYLRIQLLVVVESSIWAKLNYTEDDWQKIRDKYTPGDKATVILPEYQGDEKTSQNIQLATLKFDNGDGEYDVPVELTPDFQDKGDTKEYSISMRLDERRLCPRGGDSFPLNSPDMVVPIEVLAKAAAAWGVLGDIETEVRATGDIGYGVNVCWENDRMKDDGSLPPEPILIRKTTNTPQSYHAFAEALKTSSNGKMVLMLDKN